MTTCDDHLGVCPTPLSLLRRRAKKAEAALLDANITIAAVWDLAESWRCGLGIQIEAGFAASKLSEVLGDPDRLRSRVPAADEGGRE